jgi:hypothetical protein
MRLPIVPALRNVVKGDVLKCVVAALVGVAVALWQQLIHHGPIVVVGPQSHQWLRVYDRIGRATLIWPWNLVTAALVFGLLVRLGFKGPAAWALAYGLGALLGIVAARLLV